MKKYLQIILTVKILILHYNSNNAFLHTINKLISNKDKLKISTLHIINYFFIVVN